jgi:hypothetical protein
MPRRLHKGRIERLRKQSKEPDHQGSVGIIRESALLPIACLANSLPRIRLKKKPLPVSPGAGEGRKDQEPAVQDGKRVRGTVLGQARNRERAITAHRLGIRFAIDSCVPQR